MSAMSQPNATPPDLAVHWCLAAGWPGAPGSGHRMTLCIDCTTCQHDLACRVNHPAYGASHGNMEEGSIR